MKTWKEKKVPKVYETHGFYYFKITVDGKRQTYSTGETNKKAAEDYRDQWIRANMETFNPKPSEVKAKKSKPRLLGELMELFSVAEANPCYISAQVDGSNYSERRATAVARHMRQASEAMGPHWRSVPLSKLSRQDMINIRNTIHKAYGNTHKANDVWKSLKAVIGYGTEMGFLQANPAQGMKAIRAIEGKEKVTLGYNDVRKISTHEEWFDTELAHDVFYILATTGMRRGEFCALQGKQFKTFTVAGREVMCVNICQAWKDDAFTKLGKPKWDLVRVIPLAPSTAAVCRKYIRGKDDFLFQLKPKDMSAIFDTLTARVNPKILDRPEAMDTLTPHVMRHSLNTVLLEEDANNILVQEYLSWHHQDENKVQMGYTHVYIRGLMKVSDKIEALYSTPAEDAGELETGIISFD